MYALMMKNSFFLLFLFLGEFLVVFDTHNECDRLIMVTVFKAVFHFVFILTIFSSTDFHTISPQMQTMYTNFLLEFNDTRCSLSILSFVVSFRILKSCCLCQCLTHFDDAYSIMMTNKKK